MDVCDPPRPLAVTVIRLDPFIPALINAHRLVSDSHRVLSLAVPAVLDFGVRLYIPMLDPTSVTTAEPVANLFVCIKLLTRAESYENLTVPLVSCTDPVMTMTL